MMVLPLMFLRGDGWQAWRFVYPPSHNKNDFNPPSPTTRNILNPFSCTTSYIDLLSLALLFCQQVFHTHTIRIILTITILTVKHTGAEKLQYTISEWICHFINSDKFMAPLHLPYFFSLIKALYRI